MRGYWVRMVTGELDAVDVSDIFNISHIDIAKSRRMARFSGELRNCDRRFVVEGRAIGLTVDRVINGPQI
jgi:hypothetical protein